MTQIKTTKIPQRQECVNKEHPYIGGAKDIIDDTLNKPQSEVNAESAYLGENDGSAIIPEFDPDTDTLHKTLQVLTTEEKDQVAQNLNNKGADNGMGRIELKATDNIKTAIESQTGGNIVFVIKYDFDLNNQNVTVPENCVLDFDGGSLSNGTLRGQNTSIIAKEYIFDNINTAGSWNIPYISSRLFKDLSGNNALRQLFNLTKEDIVNDVVIEKESYNYVFSFSTLWEAGIQVKSNTNIRIDGTITVSPNGLNGYRTFFVNGKTNIRIYGSGSLIGDAEGHDYTATQEYGGQTLSSHEYCHGIVIYDTENINVENLLIKDFPGDGIALANVNTSAINNSYVQGVKIDNCGRNGMSIVQNLCIIENCEISNITRTSPRAAIDIEPNNSTITNSSIIIRNNYLHDCVQGVSVVGVAGSISSVIIENNKIIGMTTSGVYSTSGNSSIIIRNNTINNISGTACNIPAIKCCTLENNNIEGKIYLNPNNDMYPQLIQNNYIVSRGCTFVNKCTIRNNIFKYDGEPDTQSDNRIKVSGNNHVIESNIIEGYVDFECSYSMIVSNRFNFYSITNQYNKLHGSHVIFKNNIITVSKSSNTGDACFDIIGSFVEASFNKFSLNDEAKFNSAFKITNNANNHNIALLYNDFGTTLFSSNTITNNGTNVLIKGLFDNIRSSDSVPQYSGNTRDEQSKRIVYICANKQIFSDGTGNQYDALGKNKDTKYQRERKGTTVNRPNSGDIFIGMTYFDTTLGKPIYIKEIDTSTDPWTVTWVDATGATV